jgi:hypothetical protein
VYKRQANGKYATNSNGGTTWKKPGFVLSKLHALTKYSRLNLSDLEVEEFKTVKMWTMDAESFYKKINDPKVELEVAKKEKERKLKTIETAIYKKTNLSINKSRQLVKDQMFNDELQSNIAWLLHDYDELNKTKL